MSYVLYSTEVQLRKSKLMVPPISMYHLRKLLSLKDEGIDIDQPDAKGLQAIIGLIAEVIQENHPDITYESLERELDAHTLPEVLKAIQGLPKNSTAQTGMTNPAEGQVTEEKKS